MCFRIMTKFKSSKNGKQAKVTREKCLGAYGESGIRNNKKLSITNGANTSFNNSYLNK